MSRYSDFERLQAERAEQERRISAMYQMLLQLLRSYAEMYCPTMSDPELWERDRIQEALLHIRRLLEVHKRETGEGYLPNFGKRDFPKLKDIFPHKREGEET